VQKFGAQPPTSEAMLPVSLLKNSADHLAFGLDRRRWLRHGGAGYLYSPEKVVPTLDAGLRLDPHEPHGASAPAPPKARPRSFRLRQKRWEEGSVPAPCRSRDAGLHLGPCRFRSHSRGAPPSRRGDRTVQSRRATLPILPTDTSRLRFPCTTAWR
jgi:hypothetical protein